MLTKIKLNKIWNFIFSWFDKAYYKPCLKINLFSHNCQWKPHGDRKVLKMIFTITTFSRLNLNDTSLNFPTEWISLKNLTCLFQLVSGSSTVMTVVNILTVNLYGGTLMSRTYHKSSWRVKWGILKSDHVRYVYVYDGDVLIISAPKY